MSEKIIENDLSEWKEVRIGDNHIDLISGFAFKSKNFLEYQKEGSLPVIKIKNVANGDVNLEKVVYHPFDESLKKYKLSFGDVLIAMTGNHPHAKTQVVGDVSKYKLKTEALLNQRVGKIISKNNGCLEFFYYFFKDEEIHNFLANNSSGSANQANISKNDILGILSEIPPLSEQKTIAEVLSSLDDKIDLLHRQNKTLEQMAETLFRQWFVEEAKEDWEKKPLKDVVDIAIGRTPPRKESQWFSTNSNDVKWISIKDMGDDGVFIFNTSEYLTKEAIEKFNIPKIPKDTVVLSFKMTLGRVGITSEEMLSNEAIAHFKFRNETPFTKEYLYLFLKTFPYETLGSTSSIVTSINSRMIKEMIIPILSKKIIYEFKSITEDGFNKIRFNQQQIRTLEKLRDTLLPKLMNGEVRVNHVETHGRASLRENNRASQRER